MCGIVAYIGHKEAYPILLKGLKRLEYRGYDSSGVALLNNGDLNLFKKQGKVIELEQAAIGKDTSGTIGIGHTRWATHGAPSDINAHPPLVTFRQNIPCSQWYNRELLHLEKGAYPTGLCISK